jgi:hypothetical protein
VLDLLEEGTREHTITAFLEYLLLLEVAYKILEKDRSLHLRDHDTYEPYQQLAKVYKEDQYSQEGDFSERMLRLVEKIAATFKEQHPDQSKLRANSRTGNRITVHARHPTIADPDRKIPNV